MFQNRRELRSRQGDFSVGPWRVDPAAGEIHRDGRSVRLRPKVMELLIALAGRPGEVQSKPSLLDAVWPDTIVSEVSLSVAVAELRAALDNPSSGETYVETLPRRGYRLAAPVEGLQKTGPTGPESSPFSLVGRDTTVTLKIGSTTIGRDPSCDARIDSHHVSRRHAEVVVEGERIFVEDLGSKNGTFVNGDRIGTRRELHTGDRLRLGRHAATLQLVEGGTSTWTEMSAVSPVEEDVS